MSGCRMTRPVICRYVSVSCKLLSVVGCRQDLPQVIETSITTTDNSPSQDYTHPNDQTTPLHVTSGLTLKPFTVKNFSLQYQADKLDENKVKYQLGDHDYKLIQYQILQTNITRVVWQTVTRITNEILGVKGLRCCTTVKVLYQSDKWKLIDQESKPA